MTDHDPSYDSFDDEPPPDFDPDGEADPHAGLVEPPPDTGVGSLAPIWARGVARLVDLFIAGTGAIFASNLLGIITYEAEEVTIENRTSYLLVTLGVWAFYEVAGTIGGGRTVGKFLLGLRVRRVDADVPPSAFKSLTRWLIMGVAVLLGNLGPAVLAVIYLWAMTNPERQGLHDRAAQSLVVRAR